jgi:transcriptional regulator with XRE-family HTH domain
MRATDLKAFLDKTGLTPTQVAAETGLAIGTVYRFLRGETHNRVTERTLAQFVASKSKVSPKDPARSTA